MTLYLLFERLESGKLKLDIEMGVSEHASEQAPTKLGLRPGQTIKVEDAIKGLVTRSANDASVVIAEAISGDEDDFAKLMTRKARALGMSKTVYRNANGLPNSEQVTTARDQATLGRAIQERFPRYYRYFATSSFVYRGHAIRNHNRLLGNVEGVDGIKTGYTRASGFNLVTSMRAATAIWSAWCWEAAVAARAMPPCATCLPKISKGRHQAHRRRDHRARASEANAESPKPRPPRGRPRRFRPRVLFRSPPSRRCQRCRDTFDRKAIRARRRRRGRAAAARPGRGGAAASQDRAGTADQASFKARRSPRSRARPNR